MRPVTLSPINAALILPQNLWIKERVAAFAEEQARITDDQRVEAIVAAHLPGAHPDDVVALAAARERVIELNVWAVNYIPSFFTVIELAEDEWIQITNRRDQVLNIQQTNTYGEAPMQFSVHPNTTAMFILDRYSTGIVKYPIIDGVVGALNLTNQVNQDVERAWDNKINDTLDALLTAGIGSYPAGAAIVDTRIIAGTRPTTNDISMTSEGSFTWQVYQEAVEHFSLLGKNLRVIKINPTHMRNTWAWQVLVSTTSSGSQDGTTMVTSRIKEDIDTQGQPMGRLLGKEITWILDPTQAKKIAFIFSDEAAGEIYTKPSLSTVVPFTEQMLQVMGEGENQAGVQKQGWFKGLISDPDKLNFARITFES